MPLALLLAAILVVSGIWYAVFFMFLRRHVCSVPGPFPLPLIGNWLNAISGSSFTLEPKSEEPLVCYWLGTLGMRPYVFVRDPEIVRVMAREQRDTFVDRGDRSIAGFLAGDSQDSVITSRGELAIRQRRVIAPALGDPAVLDDYLNASETASAKLIHRLKNGDMDGCPYHLPQAVTEDPADRQRSVNASEIIYEHLVRIGEGSLLGFHDSVDDERFHQGQECQRKDDSFSVLSRIASLPLMPAKWWCRLSAAPIIRWLSGAKEANQMIQDHRDILLKQWKQTVDSRASTPLLRRLLVHRNKELADEESVVSVDRRMVSNMVAISNGSSKSEAAIVTFILLELAKRPELQTRLVNEFREAQQVNQAITFDHLRDLPLTKAVCDEAFRMIPAFPVFSKITEHGTHLGGFYIGKGVDTVIRVRTIQRDPKYWSQPNQFLPERHLGQAAIDQTSFTFIPFGIGRRKCPGQLLARAGVCMSLFQVLSALEVRLADDHVAPKHLMSLSISNDRPARLAFFDRPGPVAKSMVVETAAVCPLDVHNRI